MGNRIDIAQEKGFDLVREHVSTHSDPYMEPLDEAMLLVLCQQVPREYHSAGCSPM